MPEPVTVTDPDLRAPVFAVTVTKIELFPVPLVFERVTHELLDDTVHAIFDTILK